MPNAEVTGAEYLPEHERIEYTFETDDGATGTETLNKRVWGPETELSPEEMEQLADELPGTPMYDREDWGPFDPETFPTVGLDT